MVHMIIRLPKVIRTHAHIARPSTLGKANLQTKIYMTKKSGDENVIYY